MSEEIIKQENKAKELKLEFKMYQNENIVFKHKLDPVTGEVLKGEISSIKPEIRKLGKNKKILAGRTTTQ